MQNVYIGTELKLNINIEPISEMHMKDYDFKVEAYCIPNKITTITKQKAIEVDEDNYIVLIDTKEVGLGNLKCKIIANIPDPDFLDSDGTRSEVTVINTDIQIVK